MKKILLILTIAFTSLLMSCSGVQPDPKNDYVVTVEVFYENGDKETIDFKYSATSSRERVKFYSDGTLYVNGDLRAVDVRRFTELETIEKENYENY